jgi:hypothetical protein
MSGVDRTGPTVTGFSLLELMVALLLFQVGLLAVAGMVLTAQETLRRSDLILRSSLEMVRVGDSLQRAGTAGGVRVTSWGRIEWESGAPGDGSLRLWTLSPEGTDTLGTLLLASLPSRGWASRPVVRGRW